MSVCAMCNLHTLSTQWMLSTCCQASTLLGNNMYTFLSIYKQLFVKWNEVKKSFWYSLIFMCDNFSRSRSSQHPILKNCTSCFCPILNFFHRTGSKHRNSLDFFIFPGTGSVWQCWKAKSVLSTFPSVRDSAQAGQTKFQKIEKDKIPAKKLE